MKRRKGRRKRKRRKRRRKRKRDRKRKRGKKKRRRKCSDVCPVKVYEVLLFETPFGPRSPL